MDSISPSVAAPVNENSPRAAGFGHGLGVAMLVSASILWSLAGVSVKLARMDPLAFTFYRSLAAVAILVLLLPLGRRLGGPPHFGWAALGAVLYATLVTLFIVATTVSTAAAGILLQYTAPAWCALFAWLFFRRKIGPWTFAALAIASVGIGVMLVGGWKPDNWVGPVFGLASGICLGALVLVLEKNDRAAGPRGANPLAIVLINNVFTAAVVLPYCLAQGKLHVTPYQLALVGATGVVQLAIPYVLFQVALRRVRPVEASLLMLLEPVLNPLWVALATSERPDGYTVVGGAAILLAMVVEAVKPASKN
jgi:DME family drug/metabolite transporter